MSLRLVYALTMIRTLWHVLLPVAAGPVSVSYLRTRTAVRNIQVRVLPSLTDSSHILGSGAGGAKPHTLTHDRSRS